MANYDNSRKPKYKYGLLESPNTSYFSSSSANELNVTPNQQRSKGTTPGNFTGIRDASPLSDDVRSPLMSRQQNAWNRQVRPSHDSSIATVANISGISSIAGEQRGRSTEKTSNSDTLFASAENSTLRVKECMRTPKNTALSRPSTSSDSSHVFQLPTGRAPRKTPKLTPGRSSSHTTPRAVDSTLSGASSSSTPITPGHSRRTPRSARSDVTDTPRITESSNIVAIVEGRGLAKGEIGMASIDLRHPVLQLSQFSDSQTYVKTITRLHLLSPIEVIFPSTMCDAGNKVKIFRVVSDNFQNCNITTVQRHYFNEGKGLDYIKQLCVKERNSVEMDVNGKYYCLAATAALVKYVEFIQNTLFANFSLSIVFKGSEQTTLVDASTASALELVINLKNPKSEETLFGVLNHTRTAGGARMLRSNILQPPNDLETITSRHDCVQELTDEKDLFYGLKACLDRFDVDLDHLLSSLVQIPKQETERTAENKITSCILLKHILQLVPALEETLTNARSELFQAYHATMKDTRFGTILDKILSVIREGAQYQKGNLNMKTQKCFAVKEGINGLLDAARRTFSELIEDINEAITQLAEKHNLPIKCAYNASRGFFIQMTLSDRGGCPELPSSFIKVSKSKKTLSCTTSDMICMNERVNQAVKSIYAMANEVVSDMLTEIRDSIGCLYNLSETISTLDMLVSFAHIASTTEYVRPEFTDTLAVKQGRHPVLEKIMKREKPIPNNIYASDETNFNIITGPNMSGKSTYLKQVALLQIMAQIGSFVPAEYASFRLSDQIFSRVGSDDDIETNSSTFMVEMKEINYIIQNVTGNSLVIIDELGRGTSSEEGVGLCWAISEFLLSQKAFTLFATHFLELCRLEKIYPNVENFHFKIDHVTTVHGSLHKVIYTYVLSRGHTREKHYGLQLAELFNFPPSLITRARDVAKSIQESNEETDLVVAQQQKKEKAIYRLATRLLQASRSSVLEGEALKKFLQSLKGRYLADISDRNNDNENETSSPENQPISGRENEPITSHEEEIINANQNQPSSGHVNEPITSHEKEVINADQNQPITGYENEPNFSREKEVISAIQNEPIEIDQNQTTRSTENQLMSDGGERRITDIVNQPFVRVGSTFNPNLSSTGSLN
uniref:mutS protein homolog 4-like n=1 Tax=Styela clava TaxID=7725 RepID=UPI001939CB68|nr:mutS protein homolog 4-like [Styela clava]